MGRNSNGRVHPSPSSAASSHSEYLSVLNLLPAAILVLTSTLTLEDQEVLAYMIKSTSSSSFPQDSKKKATVSSNKTHSPAFSCDCFHCYTSYWSRWDSSANKDLIHRVIEDYETHLANKSKKSGRSRRRSNFKMGPSENPPMEVSGQQSSEPSPSLLPEASVISEEPAAVTLDEPTPEKVVTDEASDLVPVNLTAMEDCLGTAADGHRGLGRKVFPDVMGLFNSRIWSFWSPKF